MRVIVAEAMGLCFGVRDALAAARAVARPVEVTVFGQLVHNPAVNRELAGRGFVLAGEKEREIGDVETPRCCSLPLHGSSGSGAGRVLWRRGKAGDRYGLVRWSGGRNAAAKAFARSGHFVVVIGRAGHCGGAPD